MKIPLQIKRAVTPTPLTRKYHTTKAVVRRNGPTIMTYSGSAGAVVSAVLACRATLRANPKLQQLKAELADLNDVRARLERGEAPSYSIAEYRSDLRSVALRNGSSIAKEYAPAAALMTVSLSAIIGSHHIMLGRNAAMTATAVGLSASLNEYRKRVAEELGQEKEGEIFHNLKTVEQFDPETGKKMAIVIKDGELSPYARFFDELSTRWQDDPDLNRLTVDIQMRMANRKLGLQGHLFLNEVYDMLGLPRTVAGNTVGWLHSSNPACTGDGFVDFRQYSGRNEDFNRGYGAGALLDFNVDGPILHLIGAREI